MIAHLGKSLPPGQLFTLPGSEDKTEAFLPTDCPSNHAASLIQLKNGDLLCAWFAGLEEGSSDIHIAGARLPKGEDRWEFMGQLSEDPDCSEQNPCFFQQDDGALWLLHTAQQSRGKMTVEEWERLRQAGKVQGNFSMQETAQIRRRLSRDNGRAWGPTEVFCGNPGSFCRHPILQLSNGDWLFPMWYSVATEEAGKQYGADYSVVRLSADQGRSWQEVEIPQGVRRVHMSVVETRPGRCLAFFRSRAADRIYKSVSQDFGRTWTAPVPTALPNNNASIQAALLPSGAVAIIYNEYAFADQDGPVEWPGLRWSVTVAVTEDEGETFPWKRILEPGTGFCGAANQARNAAFEYPAILVGRDGAIHAAYSAFDRKCIRYARFTEDWLRG